MLLLNPALLGWLAALGLPILVHLLTRRSRKRLDLPTMRFVQKSLAQQSQIFKWQHLMVLILRILIVVCIVLAFTRPVITGPLSFNTSGKQCVIVIIDDGATMGYHSGSVSTLDHARQDALNILSSLHTGDQANVVICNGHPNAVLGEPSVDIGTLRAALNSLTASPQKPDPTSAINMAEQQLSLAPDTIKSKSVYIVSDFQRSNWGSVRFDALAKDVKLAFLPSVSEDRPNTGITGIHLFPAAPRVGEPVNIECELFNSTGNSKIVPVSLSLNDGYKASQTVMLSPYSSASATFPLQFDKPQIIECTSSIPGDDLSADNSRQAVLNLQQSATVLLVTDESVTDPKSAVYYLSRALHPDVSSNVGFHVVVSKPANVTLESLHSADAVIVCDANLDQDKAQYIVKYISDGGNLVWMISGASAADQLAGFGKFLPPDAPLPYTIESVEDLSGNGSGYVTLSEAHYESPLLKAFKDPAAADLGVIHFKKIAITSEVDPRAEVLLKYDDGTVAALRTGVGSGNFLLLNMSPAPAWSDLARQDAFLPLMHEFLKGLMARAENARESFAGDSASTSIATTAGRSAVKLAGFGPDGESPLTVDATTGSVVINQTTSPGFYQIAAPDKTLVGDIAVNVSPDETDLRQIDPRELESSEQKERTYYAAPSNDGHASQGHDTPFWPDLLFVGLLLLIGEQLLTAITPRRSSKGGMS